MSYGAHGVTVMVYRTERDAFGDPLDQTGHAVSGCGVLRHDTSENRADREQITETATLAAPIHADVLATDDVEMDGARWHVSGRPYVPISPLSGWEPALVVPLRRVTG